MVIGGTIFSKNLERLVPSVQMPWTGCRILVHARRIRLLPWRGLHRLSKNLRHTDYFALGILQSKETFQVNGGGLEFSAGDAFIKTTSVDSTNVSIISNNI